ncbi:hypothetical protein TNIN_142231 [Trichonephila inaurata madagascariensis]|uniref:Peptidase A2 domain-containing protein n=1 Tax=Trichonephila inaurata madagascariensis TaxID=2747483 RepID=A0A8X6WXB3_9ARAC|nr:hypothetical protein TNIN_142231 [Trichonephila inaurata madagascariensis]
MGCFWLPFSSRLSVANIHLVRWTQDCRLKKENFRRSENSNRFSDNIEGYSFTPRRGRSRGKSIRPFQRRTRRGNYRQAPTYDRQNPADCQRENRNHGNLNYNGGRQFKKKKQSGALSPIDKFDLPIVEANSQGCRFNILIDSGASVSLLSNSLFETIKNKLMKPLEISVQIRAVNGGNVEIEGCYKIYIWLWEVFIVRKSFFITRQELNVSYKAILGFDFIKLRNEMLDTQFNCLRVADCCIPFADNKISMLSNHSRDIFGSLVNKTTPSAQSKFLMFVLMYRYYLILVLSQLMIVLQN